MTCHRSGLLTFSVSRAGRDAVGSTRGACRSLSGQVWGLLSRYISGFTISGIESSRSVERAGISLRGQRKQLSSPKSSCSSKSLTKSCGATPRIFSRPVATGEKFVVYPPRSVALEAQPMDVSEGAQSYHVSTSDSIVAINDGSIHHISVTTSQRSTAASNRILP